MSERKPNPIRQKWYRAGFGVVCERLEASLNRDRQNGFRWSKEERDHVECRLGVNLYKAGRYFEAITRLNLAASGGHVGKAKAAERIKQKNALEEANDGKIFKSKEKEEQAVKLQQEIDESPIIHQDYRVHRTAARCAVELFKQTDQHYHLEVAHKHYENAVQMMPAGLVALFLLPPLLFEFGKQCEMYGAFAGAMELYSKIMTNFPNYRGYFDAMYRLCLCGRQLSSVSKIEKQRDDLLNKSIDMLQFLLEAVPPTISETHIILLYSHSLELSSDPTVRFRAAGAFQGLYDFYVASRDPIAMKAKHSNFKDWFADPEVWMTIGNAMADDGEPTLARDAYEVFYEKAEQAILFGVPDAKTLLCAENCIRVAKAYARFQSFERAVKFGELALKDNRFHKESRTLLSKWSKVHAVTLGREKRAIDAIEDSWRSRVWSSKFRRRLTAMIVDENEDKLVDDHMDFEARDQLSYYARDKWRASFLFEEECARRIQHNFREARQRWQWLAGIRAKYLGLASEAYRKFFKNPMSYKVRAEVRKVASSRFCPQKHALPRLIPLLDQQDNAAECIRRSYLAYRRRYALWLRGRQRWLNNLEQQNRMAIFVQCLVRRRLAAKVLKIRVRKQREKVAAAIVVQRYIRKVNATFRGAAWRLVCRRRWRRMWAGLTIRVILWYAFKHFKIRRAIEAEEQRRAQREAERRALEQARIALREKSARQLQHFLRACMGAALRRLAIRLLKERLKVRFSPVGDAVMKRCADQPQDILYSSPGIRQTSAAFQAMLNRVVLVCSAEGPAAFDANDCVMLSSVLRHKMCKCEHLVLHELDGTAPAFEFDLLNALQQTVAIRCVSVLGGYWTPSFLMGLMNVVQVDNPRITTIRLEGIEAFGSIRTPVMHSVGKVLGDFFNYSLPGLRELCLHGCSLRSEDLVPVLESLELNTSITTLDLGLNLLEDEALVGLLKTIQTRPKSRLRRINMTWNHIVMKDSTRDVLDAFKFPRKPQPLSSQRKGQSITSMGPTVARLEELFIDLTHNSILRPFEPHASNYDFLHVYCRPEELPYNRTAKGDVIDGQPGVTVIRPEDVNSPPSAAGAGAGAVHGLRSTSAGGEGLGAGDGEPERPYFPSSHARAHGVSTSLRRLSGAGKAGVFQQSRRGRMKRKDVRQRFLDSGNSLVSATTATASGTSTEGIEYYGEDDGRK